MRTDSEIEHQRDSLRQHVVEPESSYEAEYGVVESKERVVVEPKNRRRQIGGAAIAGGVAGVLLIGPVGGIILAGSAAALAVSSGKAGELARSTGGVTSDAVEKVKEFDREHHIVQRSSQSIVKGYRWVSKKLQGNGLEENGKNAC